MKAHYFIGSDGALHDTRDSDWSAKPLRRDYSRTFGTIATVAELNATIRNGGSAWPGGFPLFFATNDGAALAFEAVRQNFRTVADSIRGDHSDGWRVVACAVN